MLESVFERMGEVIHRIDAPRLAGIVMFGVQDPIDHRIAHVEVGRGHVDFGAQHAIAFLELTGAHAAEEVEVFLQRALAVGRVDAGLGEIPAAGAHLLGALLFDVCLAVRD